MSIDPYSLCPGGRDKKIRFCCPDMVKDIEHIEKLLESGQTGACFSLIETLEKTHANCACLTAARLTIYRAESRWQEALPLAQHFLEREPNNPVAIAETALALSGVGQIKESLHTLIDGFERSPQGLYHSALTSASLQIAYILNRLGVVVPANFLAEQLKRFPSAQDGANAILKEVVSQPEVPIFLRDITFEYGVPPNFPAPAEYENAIDHICFLRWKKAVAELQNLAERYAADFPVLWRNVAIVQCALADFDAGRETLHKYSSHPKAPLEDAVDTESLRVCLSHDALGDAISMFELTQPVKDAEKVHELLLSSPYFQSLPFEPQAFVSTNEVPPKGIFACFDRPKLSDDICPTLEQLPVLYGSCMVFGKQTDRSAKILLGPLFSEQRSEVETLLRQTIGDYLDGEQELRELSGISRTQYLLTFSYQLNKNPELRKTISHLRREHFETLFPNTWVQKPLGLLDGKTPEEAATLPEYRVRLLAAIQVVGQLSERGPVDIAGALRKRLNLPDFGSIPIPNDPEEAGLLLDVNPIWRWHRIDPQQLPTETLAAGAQIAIAMHEQPAAFRFAKELLARPTTEMPFEIRQMAYMMLVESAKLSGDLTLQLEIIKEAKAEVAANAHFTDSIWDLQELMLSVQQGIAADHSQEERQESIKKLYATIQHLVTVHQHEEYTMAALQDILVDMGLMTPEGQLRSTPPQAGPVAENTSGNTRSSGLWVPD